MSNADLIAALEAGPGSRELSDRVMRACSQWKPYNDFEWLDPHGRRVNCINIPDPTRNLQDIVDLVPEGWVWGKYSKGGIFLHPSHSPKPLIDGGGFNSTMQPISVQRSFCIAVVKAKSHGE